MTSSKTLFKPLHIIITLLICILLLLLPEVVKLVLVKTITSSGYGEVTIDDVDLNIFSATASMENLTLFNETDQKLSISDVNIDISWLKLFRGIIYIEQFTLQGAQLAAVQGDDGHWEVVIPWEVNEEQASKADDDISVSVELPRIAAANLQLIDVELTVDSLLTKGVLNIERLQIDQVSSWLNEEASIRLMATWDDAPFELDMKLSPWDDEPSLDGSIVLKNVSVDAMLPVADDLEAVSGLISLAVDIDAGRNEQGDINVGLNGEVKIEQLKVGYKILDLAGEAISWQGEGGFTQSQQSFEYSLNGDLASSNLTINDNKQKLQLLAWQQFDLQSFSFDQLLSADFEQLSIKELNLIKGDQESRGMLYTGLLDIQQFKLLDNDLNIDQVNIGNGQYQIQLAKDGQLQLQKVLTTSLANLNDAKESNSKESNSKESNAKENNAKENNADANDDSSVEQEVKPLSLVINTFNVAEGSYVTFSDERFSVPVKQQLNIKQFKLTDLNQKQSDKSMEIFLEGSLGEFSNITLNGTLNPFAKKLSADLKGSLEAIPLQDLSPYSEAYMGYHLKRGQYDHQFEVLIVDDDIRLKNNLLLRKLTIEPVDADKPQPMARELDVPLGLALDMLRDGEDNIKLDVPIKGRIDKPDIDISQVVNKALATALKSGASNFLKLTLQPYGAVLMAAEFVGGKMSAINLEPIVFAAGSSEMSSEHRDYITKITGLMQQRPQLNLTLCASANERDKTALELLKPNQLIDEGSLIGVASDRGTHLKRELLEQGINGKRIFICQPTYSATKKDGVTLKM